MACNCKRKCNVDSCFCLDNGLNCSEDCTYQECENVGKESDDIKEDNDLSEQFSDDDDHFDDDLFLSL